MMPFGVTLFGVTLLSVIVSGVTKQGIYFENFLLYQFYYDHPSPAAH